MKQYLRLVTGAIIIAFISAIPVGAFSQTIPDPKIESPNMQSFDKYGEVPVNMFTGTPDISIPIHRLTYGKIAVPINLRYHPAAVKPLQHPGWVGLGWDLESMGAITRTINQGPDEFYSSSMGAINPYYPYSGNPSADGSGSEELQLSNWNTTSGLNYYFSSTNTRYPADVQPDEFDFNFLGHSGKFFYQGPTLGWQVVSDEDIKVQLDPTNDFFSATDVENEIAKYAPHVNTNFNQTTQPRAFKSFILTTPDGTRYFFGGVDAVEFHSAYGAIPTYPEFFADAWFLTKIIDANNNEVDFGYTRTYPTCDLYLHPPENWSISCQGTGPIGQNQSLYQIGSVDGYYTGEFHFPLYLASISSPNETINFSASTATCLRYSDTQFRNLRGTADPQAALQMVNSDFTNLQWEKLDNITIQDASKNTYKQFQFNYDNGLDLTKQRLALYTLTEQDGQSNTIGAYQFKYDNANGKTIADLPLYDGNYTDHYGYYNGVNLLNQTPAQMPTLRQTNSTLVTTGLLSKIIYPTGGYTVFTWEAHDYSQYLTKVSTPSNQEQLNSVTGTAYAGGSRIRDISNFLADNTLATEKTYYYKRGYNSTATVGSLTSSGILNGLPNYVFDVSNRIGISGSTWSIHLESINTMNSYGANGAGSYLGYDEVAEVNRDGSYTRNYFTSYGTDYNGVSHFDQFPLAMIGWIATDPYLPYSTLENERGKLVANLQYTSGDILVQKTVNTYRSDIARFDSYLRTIRHTTSYACTTCGSDGISLATANKIFSYNYYPVTTAVTNYDLAGNNGVTSSQTFLYNTSNLVINKISTNSRNESIVTLYKYPTDVNQPTDPNYSVCQQMVAAHIISPVVETSATNNNSQVNITDVYYYTPSTGIYVPQSVQVQVGNNAKEARQQFYNYDTNGNVREISKANGPHDVYLWGYNHAFIIAKITNSTYSAVQQVLANNSITQLQLDNAITLTDTQLQTMLNTLRTGLSSSLVTTYTYLPIVGMTSMTDPKGETTFYEYDFFDRLKDIKDKDGNIVKSFCYNYAGQSTNCYVDGVKVYYSAAKSGIFSKNDCGTGYSGSPVTYPVAQGAYTSFISQADADQKAQNDVNAKGQTYANNNGSCSRIIMAFQITNNTGLSGFVLNFTGTDNSNNLSFNIPATGGTNVQVPWGTYNLLINPIGDHSNHSFKLGTRTPMVAPGMSYNGIQIMTGSSDLTLTIN